ncbi:transporter [candidate division FCPU426 bacterium]|nr:transporter [candidate division FCPU426 bacterium]
MFKKSTMAICAGLVAVPLLASGEPIAFDQAANVTGLTGIEAGAEFDYSYEKIETEGQAAVESTVSDIPVFLRLGFPVLEAKLTVPFGSVKSNVEAVGEENYSGVKDLGIGLKTGLLGLPLFNLAVGVNFTLPTGDPEKYLGEGLDFNPYVAADVDITLMKLHANVGYEYRGEYNKEIDISTDPANPQYEPVKIKPGDAMHWALGVEIPTGDIFKIHAELLGVSYGEVKSADQVVENSAGNTMTFIPGISLQQGIFKAKVGYGIPVEVEDDRPAYAPRYDWRIIGGASLIFAF